MLFSAGAGGGAYTHVAAEPFGGGSETELTLDKGTKLEVLEKVRVVRRSISPRWGSIQFRLALRTYDAPPLGVRVVG